MSQKRSLQVINWFPAYIVIPFVAWLVAQLLKPALELTKPPKQRTKSRNFFRSGNMPSAHSATVVALVTTVGGKLGLDDPLFGITVILSSIVLYDAVNVRRAVGEQGDILKKLLSFGKHNESFFSAYGHTIQEVVVGAIIGVAVAALMLQIL
jgi:uncharacterized protein